MELFILQRVSHPEMAKRLLQSKTAELNAAGMKVIGGWSVVDPGWDGYSVALLVQVLHPRVIYEYESTVRPILDESFRFPPTQFVRMEEL